MKPKSQPNQAQTHLFQANLKQLLNPDHPLLQLAEKINWQALEEQFASFYSPTGRAAHPVRLMVSFLILKQMYDLGDETLPEAWVQNPYFQYFSGFAVFQWKFPIATSDLTHFRKRIGAEGVEAILKASVDIQDKRQLQCQEVLVDTTVQPKNVTFPTDGKLRVKVIEKCVSLAKKEGIVLRQTFRKELKSLKRHMYYGHHPKRKKKATKALKRLQTIANYLIRELKRKLPAERRTSYGQELSLFEKAANQTRYDKDKVYSLHEPAVACIAKGKAHPKYEFGSKVSVALTKNTNLILGIASFTGNPHDSKTLEATLAQVKRITGKTPQAAIVDRGYTGIKQMHETEILRPDNGMGTKAKQRKARKRFRRRAAIEPVISHLKSQYRMIRNYLKGTTGDKINAILAAAAYNFKSWINQILASPYFLLVLVWSQQPLVNSLNYQAIKIRSPKMSF